MDIERDGEDVGAIFIGVTWFAFIQAGICLYSNILRVFKTIQTDFNCHSDTSPAVTFFCHFSKAARARI